MPVIVKPKTNTPRPNVLPAPQPKTKFMEDIFEKYKIKEIIAYSGHEKLQ